MNPISSLLSQHKNLTRKKLTKLIKISLSSSPSPSLLMASSNYQRSNSNSSRALARISVSSPNHSPTQSTSTSTSAPSPDVSKTQQQQQPQPAVVAVNHRSSSLSPDLRSLYQQVFTSFPQNPHFNPLSNFTEETKEGLKLGLDVSFVNFVKKFHIPVEEPSVFLAEVETYTKQLAEFENMGYDVSKLKERLNLLRRRAEQHKALKFAIDELQEEEKEKEAKVEAQEFRLKEIEEENKRITKALQLQKIEIENVNMKKRKIMEDSSRNMSEFKRFASNSPWS
ncbi:hypothetical protein MKX03_025006 [Papaver bracteatum]|nr:hypothetical protein MKX03_025006 [Papaver bracteatum]